MSIERRPAVSVIMPVYNERTTIEEIILRVQDVDLDKEIVIVDDASTDGTREFLADLAEHATPNTGVMTLPAVGRSVRADTGQSH
jgi:glycosyltransferase involved in cell wall biosynthesis